MAFFLFVFQLVSTEKRKPPLDISDKVMPAEGCFAFSCMLGAAAKHSCEACNLKVPLKNSLSKKNKINVQINIENTAANLLLCCIDQMSSKSEMLNSGLLSPG